MSLTLTLPGIPPSKKNNLITRIIKRMVPKKSGDGMKEVFTPLVFPSSDYKKWEAEAVKILRAQVHASGERTPIPGPMHIGICYLVSDDRRWDLDNKDSSLMDTLMEAGIIEDDRRQIVATRWTGWKECEKGQEGVQITLDQIVPS